MYIVDSIVEIFYVNWKKDKINFIRKTFPSYYWRSHEPLIKQNYNI